MKLIHIVAMIFSLIIGSVLIWSGLVYADPLSIDMSKGVSDPINLQLQAEHVRVNGLPGGQLDLSLSWTSSPDEGTPGFGYIVYFGPDTTTADTTVYASDLLAQFPPHPQNANSRILNIPDAVCTMGLQRSPQNVCFGLRAFNDSGKSGFAGPICTSLTADNVAGLCSPKGLTVTVTPTPVP